MLAGAVRLAYRLMNSPVNRSRHGLSARAALSSYFVLAGIWIGLGVAYTASALADADRELYTVSILCISVGSLWIVWLRGFKLRIIAGVLEYRDGLYRSVRIPAENITEVKFASLKWRFLFVCGATH